MLSIKSIKSVYEDFVEWANKGKLKDMSGNNIKIDIDKLVKTRSDLSNMKLNAFIKHIITTYKIANMDYKTILKMYKDEKAEFQVDSSLDTNETCYVGTLEGVSYDTLLNIFGDPIHTSLDVDNGVKHRYEWKLQGEKCVYSIYDWISTDKEFHIATNKKNKNELEKLINYVTHVERGVEQSDYIEEEHIEDEHVEDEHVEDIEHDELTISLENIDFKD